MPHRKFKNLRQDAHYSARIYQGYLEYLQRKFGLVRAKEIIARTGTTWEYLSNESNWVSESYAEIFYDVLSSEPEIDPDFSYQAGKLAMSHDLQGAVQLLMIQLLEPQSIYKQLVYFSGRFNKIDTLTLSHISKNEGHFSFQSHRQSRHLHLIEQNWQGFMEAVPMLVGLPPASFKIIQRSDRSFAFEVKWITSRWMRLLRNVKVFLTLLSPIVLSWILWSLPLKWFVSSTAILISLVSITHLYIDRIKARLSRFSYKNVAQLLKDTEEKYAELREHQLALYRRYQESNLLNRVFQRMSAAKDSSDLISKTIEELSANLNFGRIVFLEFNQTAGQLQPIASHGFNQNESMALANYGIRVRSSDRGSNLLLERIFQNKEGSLIQITSEMFQTLSLEEKSFLSFLNLKTFVACCVATQKVSFGVLLVDQVRSDRRLNQDDLQIVQNISSQLAICLENVKGYEVEKRLRLSFQRFVPSQVVQSMLDETQSDLAHGVARDMTVLYSDLRAFTRRCSTTDPKTLIHALNYYLQSMTDIVYQHGGIVDKFMGDGILAEFNIFGSTGSHTERAVAAACAMQNRMHDVNQWIRSNLFSSDPDWVPFEAGIGIHTGNAIVGYLGTQNKTEFTAIGDTVNLACRLGEVSKRYSASIIVSEATLNKVSFAYRSQSLGPIRIRGLDKEENLHLILGTKIDIEGKAA